MTKRGSFIGVIVLILAFVPIMNSAAATIVVRARGVEGGEQIRVEVGGSTVRTFTLSTSLNNYTATTNNTGAINVRFINNNNTNRDVQVDYIDVNGERRQAENQSTNTGVYQNNKCGGSNSEWLHCNGYIAFGNVGSGTATTSGGSGNLTVRARGTKGGEKLKVQANGTTVASFTISTRYADYKANGSGTIRIAFTNDDQQQNGMDIQVDYVVIDGTIYEAENQTTNTGVYQNNKCGGSNSEWLHCNGYIEFNTGSTPAATNAPTPTPGTSTTTTSVMLGQGHGWLSAGVVNTSTITTTTTTSVIGSPPSTTTTTAASTSIVGSTGNVYLFAGWSFLVVIHVNTGTATARSFGFTITYPTDLVLYKGAEEIVSGCNLTVDSGTPGTLRVTGFNANGIQGSSDLMLVRLTCQAKGRGNGSIPINVDKLTDLYGNTIGILSGTGITFTMEWVTTSIGGGGSTTTTTTSAAGPYTTTGIGM